jgi:two-component system, chemotaxis family, sensor kinase CheA
METSDYLPMFVAECREHLQELNDAVMEMEEKPGDRHVLDEIFRIAHSLKGMSGAMGFSQMAHLTHEMENVLELVRQGTGTVGREMIDILLACLDGLSSAVEAVDSTGAEALDAVPLVARLHALVGQVAADGPLEDAEGVEGGEAPPVAAAPAEPAAAGQRRLQITVRLERETQMRAVRAFMTLNAAADAGAVVASNPPAEAVDSFTGSDISITLDTDKTDDEVVLLLRSVPDVQEVAIEQPRAEQKTEADDNKAGGHAAKKGSSTVRVDAERLDQLMHLMGELVVHRTRVESLVSEAGVTGLAQAMQDMTRSSQALQAMVMQVRMIPVEAVFARFPRLIRDLSTKLDKQVNLVLTGKDTELDRTVVEELGDPLVHLIRNSLDHGLESPDVRVARGKPETGTLEIGAQHAGGNVVISVTDDGAGVDPARVARKAVERGLIPAEAEASVDVAKAIELLFMPGFSTAEQMSDVSGRGVGMDAVRTAIRELGGEVVVTSVPGQGTTAQIRLPLTLAIMASLIVDAGGMPLALPLDRVESTLRLAEHTVRSTAGRPMLVLRDGVLPLIDLAAALGYESNGPRTHAVIVRGDERRLALAVDELVGQRELVTRPLPPEVSASVALSGAAVLAAGEIALIVDCDALASFGSHKIAEAA